VDSIFLDTGKAYIFGASADGAVFRDPLMLQTLMALVNGSD